MLSMVPSMLACCTTPPAQGLPRIWPLLPHGPSRPQRGGTRGPIRRHSSAPIQTPAFIYIIQTCLALGARQRPRKDARYGAAPAQGAGAGRRAGEGTRWQQQGRENTEVSRARGSGAAWRSARARRRHLASARVRLPIVAAGRGMEESQEAFTATPQKRARGRRPATQQLQAAAGRLCLPGRGAQEHGWRRNGRGRRKRGIWAKAQRRRGGHS
jgi:hypothetical protein